MDSNGTFARSFDEPLIRIAPLREPVSSRILSIPLPLEPNASGVRETASISKTSNSSGILPTRSEPNTGASECLSAAPRPKKSDFSTDPLLEPPPRPILPAFVNLRALERFPYSSFDDDNLHSRKRRRVDVQADSFGEHLQLPIPQTQKEQRPPPFGPFAILNGLNEPPPNAALLPPIEAGSITQLLTKPSQDSFIIEPSLLASNLITDTQGRERREGRIEEILDTPIVEKLTDTDQSSVENVPLDTARIDQLGPKTKAPDTGQELPPVERNDEPLSPKSRGRSRKNLRKWTDEETTALLRGVIKCGIGNWTTILAQPELKFNKRSASNLKDRFRVCCPWAYQAADPNEATKQLHETLTKALARTETECSDGTLEKFHIPQPLSTGSESTLKPVATLNDSLPPPSSSSRKESDQPPQKTSKTPNKPSSLSKSIPTLSSRSKSALASLGIPEPHFTVKSKRRSRRPFTTTEDEALLKGYAAHGFQWTLIQQDKRLNLGHRRATDLRDRFRTKFPQAYQNGGSVSGQALQSPNKDVLLKDGTYSLPGGKSETTKRPSSDGPLVVPHSPESVPVSGSIDAVLSSPIPTQGSSESSIGPPPPAVFPFPLDETSASTASVDTSWAANTLPPMIWDDLP